MKTVTFVLKILMKISHTALCEISEARAEEERGEPSWEGAFIRDSDQRTYLVQDCLH